MERMVTLNRKEQKRLMVISKVERGEVGGGEAAVGTRYLVKAVQEAYGGV